MYEKMKISELITKELKPGSACLILSSPLAGREQFIRQLFYESLFSNYAAIYVTTDNFADDIIKYIETLGYELKDREYVFIDTYSQQANPALEDSENIKYVASVADLAKLSNNIVSSLGKLTKKSSLLIFNSLDTLLMHVSPQSVYRFLYYLRAKTRFASTTSLLMLDPKLHDEKVIKMICQLSDVLININEERNLLELTFASSLKKAIKYNIGKKGFVLQQKLFILA
ncbi:MAG: hypothetical protein QME47_04710 [Candidatus Thermoplasmatota archaeon]|nr:hypothetical protein [Candidatus Thermoplasmatota archaeon]